jgi:hypothetical protein
MNRKNEQIESRLERSLRNQVRAPKLDGRFDAAVWARIEKEAAPKAAPAPRKLPGWLVASNAVAALVTIALIVFVGAESLSGVDVGAELGVKLPQVAPGLVERVIQSLAWPITGVALLIGLKFTGIWRRLRAEYL